MTLRLKVVNLTLNVVTLRLKVMTLRLNVMTLRFKVMKGGSWNSNLDLARGSVRGKAFPDDIKNYIGFRCVATN